MVARFHYDEDVLERFLRGRLRGDEGGVTSHIEECETCQRNLEIVSRAELPWDELPSLLGPNSNSGSSAQDSPEISDAGHLAGSMPLSFLQPSERANSIGRFGRYEILEMLGRGGMGIVMRGMDSALDRHCAVKVLAPEFVGSAAARRRFSREARSAAAVVHPHVVPIQTVDEHDGIPYLVMPVVEGRSLQQRVEQNGPLKVIEVVRIAAQVAAGLSAAHSQGLVHRDIKPANVLLENGVERVQITDFGLARAVDDASMTRSGVIAGTPQYMSPEQAHGDAIDQRSDLFSLGSVMYFMLTGRSPFRAETPMGVLNRICNDQPRSLRSINADVPAWLATIVTKLLEKSPGDRFQSATEVAGLLGDYLAAMNNPESTHLSSLIDAQSTPETQQSSSAKPPSGVRNWLLAAGFAFLAVAGTIFFVETNKGTLRIESNSDVAVPIRILSGDETVEEITVSKNGATTRLKAGNYIIELDDTDSHLEVKGDRFTLRRGDTWTVAITPVQDSRDDGLAKVDEGKPMEAPGGTLGEHSIAPGGGKGRPFAGNHVGEKAIGDTPTDGAVDGSVDKKSSKVVTEAHKETSSDAKGAPTPLDQLQGSWRAIASTDDKTLLKSLTFYSDRVGVVATEGAAEGIVTLPEIDTKGAIDFRWALPDKYSMPISRGLYEIRDGTLWLCMSTEGKPRPTDLETDQPDATLVKYVREWIMSDLPSFDPSKTLDLQRWAGNREGAGVATTFSLFIPGRKSLLEAKSIHAPMAPTYELTGVPGFGKTTFTVQLFLPNLSPRGMEYLARNSIAMVAWPNEFMAARDSKRVVKACYLPDTAEELTASSVQHATLTNNRSQAEWLGDLDREGDILIVYELVRGRLPNFESQNDSNPRVASVSGIDTDDPTGWSPDQASELIDTLSQIAENARKQYRLGEATILEVIRAEQKLLGARLEIAGADERPLIRQSQLQLATDLEAIVEEAVKQGQQAPAELLKAKAERLELESTIRREEDGKATAPADDDNLEAYIHGTGKVVALFSPDQQHAGSSPVPDPSELAVELWIAGSDAPLVQRGAPVRLQFEGWPVVESAGTFRGEVMTIDPTADGDGRFRILVTADGNDSWPDKRYLRPGVPAIGWVLTEDAKRIRRVIESLMPQ